MLTKAVREHDAQSHVIDAAISPQELQK
jgi:hypothetical protein